MVYSRRFWVKEPRHSETILDKKGYLYRSTRLILLIVQRATQRFTSVNTTARITAPKNGSVAGDEVHAMTRLRGGAGAVAAHPLRSRGRGGEGAYLCVACVSHLATIATHPLRHDHRFFVNARFCTPAQLVSRGINNYPRRPAGRKPQAVVTGVFPSSPPGTCRHLLSRIWGSAFPLLASHHVRQISSNFDGARSSHVFRYYSIFTLEKASVLA